MAQRKDMNSANSGNKRNTQGIGRTSDELPAVGSYFAIRRYCLNRGMKSFSYDEFDDRLPRPKRKNEPGGPKIVVRKGAILRKKQAEEAKVLSSPEDSPDKSNKSAQLLAREDFSNVEQLEKQLVQLLRSISRVAVKKSGKNNYQDLLKQIYHKLEELIKIDPSKAKSPLSTELQKAYDKLRAVV